MNKLKNLNRNEIKLYQHKNKINDKVLYILK